VQSRWAAQNGWAAQSGGWDIPTPNFNGRPNTTSRQKGTFQINFPIAGYGCTIALMLLTMSQLGEGLKKAIATKMHFSD